MPHAFNQMKRNNPWMLIIIIILAFSALFMVVSNLRNKHLDAYTESDRVDQYEYTEEKKEMDTYTYTNEEYGFSLQIPSDWEKIEENGVISFIHSPSSSSIKLVCADYDPNLNNMDETTMSNQVSSNGYQFVSFRYLTTSNYELVYQDTTTNVYDYMEEVFWNKEKQVNVLCTFSDKNYEKILPYYQTILSSFAWTNPDLAIDENMKITYIPSVGAQFALPKTWETAINNNAVSAYDAESATNFTFIIEPMNHEQLTGVDISNYLNENFTNFVMNSYDGNEENGHALCTYQANNIQWVRNAYVFTKNNIAYFLIYDYQQGMLDEKIPETCKEYFKLFDLPQEDAPSTESTENTNGQNPGESSMDTTATTEVPTDASTQQQENIPQNTEPIANPDGGESSSASVAPPTEAIPSNP